MHIKPIGKIHGVKGKTNLEF